MNEHSERITRAWQSGYTAGFEHGRESAVRNYEATLDLIVELLSGPDKTDDEENTKDEKNV